MQHDLLMGLKTETEASHKRLEDLLDIANPGLTRSGYIELLCDFLGFLAPWEHALRAHLPMRLEPFLMPRLKTNLLIEDLTFLCGEPQCAGMVSRCTALPRLDGAARQFGSMYVMEGSTLGGRVIAPLMMERFGLGDGRGVAYFHAYGLRTGSMWNSFRAAAVAEVAPHDYDDAIAAARETFERLTAWFGASRQARAATVSATIASEAALAPPQLALSDPSSTNPGRHA